MKKILIVMGRYLPGYKDGGPVRSTKNLVDQLGKEYDIRVLCYDRDHGDTVQYPGIRINDWNLVGNGLVYYVSERGITNEVLVELSKQVNILYLWGCFNYYTMRAIFLRRINKIKIPVVVAAMGLFSPNAFHMKYAKKKIVTTILNITGMFRNVYWSATSGQEAEDIKKQVRTNDEKIFIAQDLPRIVDGSPIYKEKGKTCLKVVWISRIAWEKNLLGAVKILSGVKAKIDFTIYGPNEYDLDCWKICQPELERLPENIHWEYRGNVGSEQVVETLRHHHVFLFPTLGENYGHVIQEALSAGCPCIISDQTPWQDLEENGVGYVLPLEDTDSFVKAVEEYAAMDEEEFNRVANKAVQYAVRNSNEKVKNTGYRKIFELG